MPFCSLPGPPKLLQKDWGIVLVVLLFPGTRLACLSLTPDFLFSLQKKVMLNMFLDTLMADPPPQCLVWLPLMHRLAHVENGMLNACLNLLSL